MLREEPSGHVRLEDPHGPPIAVDGGSPLPLVAEIFRLLPVPGFGLLIVVPDTMMEFARQPPMTDLSPTSVKPPAAHATQRPRRTDNDDGFAHTIRLHSRTGPAADNHINILLPVPPARYRSGPHVPRQADIETVLRRRDIILVDCLPCMAEK